MGQIYLNSDLTNKDLLLILIISFLAIGSLPYIGKYITWILSTNKFKKNKTEIKKTILRNICTVSESLAKSKTGAIITIERKIPVKNFVNAGEEINADVSPALIESIFQIKSPLHDGAIVISGNRITLAGTYYRVSTKKIASYYGTRHRASLGISEDTDAITIVISEERGKISIARNNNIKPINRTDLYAYLEYIFI